jgi:hypothetical protein
MKLKWSLLFVTLCIVVGTFSASATTIGTTDPALFNATVDWSQLGNVGNTFTGLTPWISSGGDTGIVFSSPEFRLMQQGNNWGGNFANGMHLLWNEGLGGNIEAVFNQPVYGAGGFIQTDLFGLFDATISLLDFNYNVLDSFTATGVANNLGNGSALFVGMLDTKAEVYGVSFSAVGTDLTSGNFGSADFALGSMGLSTVPEPATLLLLGSGFGVMGLLLRRRTK